ncbi:hypothetical protein GJ744_010633 [Endocarpon pusillum]|uniref:Uncharacterized protein n=1 Tax=Endocarpon pusillum TaxID=364733 RepID=A0A8H7E8K0_9EURO|nr:hypothetical protein GJ744_010633 [Endocarpon pusillum]
MRQELWRTLRAVTETHINKRTGTHVTSFNFRLYHVKFATDNPGFNQARGSLSWYLCSLTTGTRDGLMFALSFPTPESSDRKGKFIATSPRFSPPDCSKTPS